MIGLDESLCLLLLINELLERVLSCKYLAMGRWVLWIFNCSNIYDIYTTFLVDKTFNTIFSHSIGKDL